MPGQLEQPGVLPLLSLAAVTAAELQSHSPWRQVHRDREGALPTVQRRHGHRLDPSRERPAQVDLRTG